jgi:hypothetical protein
MPSQPSCRAARRSTASLSPPIITGTFDKIEFFLQPTGAYTEDHSPRGKQLGGRQLLGNMDGMSHW